MTARQSKKHQPAACNRVNRLVRCVLISALRPTDPASGYQFTSSER
jgi:hypothetical protein